MATTRERMEARAERRHQWAEGREAKAAALRAVGESYRHDWAFITQPGHIPERARMNARDDRAHEHAQMAAHHEQRAAGIEAQLERSIYSDDADAVERLTARIAELEGERQRLKAYNASCRRGERDLTLLDERQRQDMVVTMRVAPYQIGKRGEFPGYALSNLGGNIARKRKRLEALRPVG